MAHHDQGPGPRPSSPWTSGRVIASSALVATLVVFGVVLVLARVGGGDGDAAAAPSAPSATTSESAPEPSESACGLPAGDQRVPAVAPQAAWELVGRVAAPSAPGVGPGARTPIRSCFARSPVGAVFAAINYLVVVEASGGDEDVVRYLAADTPALEETLDQAGGTDDGSGAQGTPEPQVRGFQISGYNADEATVSVVMHATSDDGATGLVSVTLPLRWERGDWKLIPPDTAAGGPQFDIRAVDSTAGFIPWSGT